MRLVLIDDDGTVLGDIDGVDGYDLDTPLSAAVLKQEVVDLLRRHARPQAGVTDG